MSLQSARSNFQKNPGGAQCPQCFVSMGSIANENKNPSELCGFALIKIL